jgi:uncharacterized protein involved in outer membrane biogenesis
MVRKIILGIVIIFVVLLAGLFIFINTFDLNKYLPQITRQAGQSIGREVKIERARLHLSITQGVSASVEGVAVSDDPNFGQKPFLTVGQIRCGVRLIPLLTKQRVEVSYIRIQKPEINLIKGKSGQFNFESLMKASAQQTLPSGNEGTSKPSEPSSAPNLPVLLVSSFQVEKAKVSYADQAMTPPLEVAAQDIDVEVTDFSLTEPFKIKGAASLFSGAPNVHLSGTGRLDMRLQQVRLDDVHVDADLSAIDVKKLNKAVAALEPVGIQSIRGHLNAAASQMLAGAGGLLVLTLEGQLNDGQVSLKPLAVPMDKIFMKFDASESKINVKEFFVGLSSGEVRGQGTVKDYMTTQDFDFNIDINKIPLGDVIDQKNYPAQIKGSASGNIKISGQGFTPEAMDRMTGQAAFSIADGEVVNMNLVKSVLDRISFIPGLAQSVENQLPPSLKQTLSGNNTKIDAADVKTHIERSQVIVDDAIMQAQGFRLSARGNAGFDQTLSMQAELILLKDLAGATVASAKQMAALVDENQEIHIPVRISGKVPAVSVMPDLNYLSKRIAVNEGSKQLEKVIDKNPEVKKFLNIFTGGDQSGNQGAAQPDTQEPAGNQESESPQKKLLNNLFKGF